jgi:GNAT superfamily N-acetyltransferase
MIILKRTTSEDPDFIYLTRLFDEFLIDIDGDEKDFFAQYNQIYIKNVIIYYESGIALGCGAFKEFEKNVAEIKRMFVIPESRGKGIASQIVTELEVWYKEENYSTCILETSIKLENAISLYKKFGFQITPNYGQYIDVESSVCMMKKILY